MNLMEELEALIEEVERKWAEATHFGRTDEAKWYMAYSDGLDEAKSLIEKYIG